MHVEALATQPRGRQFYRLRHPAQQQLVINAGRELREQWPGGLGEARAAVRV
jgi:hypothetical protein